MDKYLVELNEAIEWHKSHLGEFQANSDKVNFDYFKAFTDGLLHARDLYSSQPEDSPDNECYICEAKVGERHKHPCSRGNGIFNG